MSVWLGDPAAPCDEAVAVTKSDTVAIALANVRYLYVGGTGDVSVQMALTGSAILFSAVPAGTLLPIRITRVNNTNTSASLMVALA